MEAPLLQQLRLVPDGLDEVGPFVAGLVHAGADLHGLEALAGHHQVTEGLDIALIGVEEPGCLIHAPNESVDPTEIENMALAEALFLSSYATAR